MNVMSRFLRVFLRDKVLKWLRADHKVIKEGTTSAHAGDPLFNATIFKKRDRSDDKSCLCKASYDNECLSVVRACFGFDRGTRMDTNLSA